MSNTTYRVFISLFLFFILSSLKAQTGAALNFDGTNDYVALPAALTAALTDQNNTGITIEYWFKGTPQSAVRFQVGSDYIVSGWNGKHIISTEGGTTGISMGGINTVLWNHVAMVWEKDKVNGFRSYLNGALVAQRSTNGGVLPFMNASSAGNIGCYLDNNGLPLEKMQGSIDEIRIWTVARQACEIEFYMNCNVDNNAQGLLAYYKCNQGTANSLNTGITSLSDATTNSYNGTLTNFALNGTTSNWISPSGMPVNSAVCTGFPSIDVTLTNGHNPTCPSTSLTFTAASSVVSSNTKQWKNDGVTVATGNTYTDAGITEGSITCEVTLNNGCLIHSTPTIIKVVGHFPNINLVNTVTSNCANTASLRVNGVGAAEQISWSPTGQTSAVIYDPAASTIAGVTGAAGNSNTRLDRPTGVFVRPNGDIYIADYNNSRIQLYAVGSPNGETVLNDGILGSELLNPTSVFIDASDNMYVVEKGRHRVLKFSLITGNTETVAGGNGQGSAANQLNNPNAVFVDAAGNIYVADTDNHRVVKWAAGSTTGVTVAGDGFASASAGQLNAPSGVFVGNDGSIYVADKNNNRVQKWAVGATIGTTVAGGNGQGNAANQLNAPLSIFVDIRGVLFIADRDNHRIQKWAVGATSGTTVIGGFGTTNRQLNTPTGIFVDENGSLFIADQMNHRIQKYELNTAFIPPVGGSYTATVSNSLGCSATSNAVFVADMIVPSVAIARSTGTNPTCGGTPIIFTATSVNGGTSPVYTWYKNGVVVGTNSATYTDVGQTAGSVYCQLQANGINCLVTNIATSSTLSFTLKTSLTPSLIATNGDCISNNSLQIKGAGAAAQVQWKRNGTVIQTSDITYNSAATSIPFSIQMGWVSGLYVDDAGNVYASDELNNRVVKWTASTGLTAIVAGGNGLGAAANQLYNPKGIWVDANNNLYIADADNHRIVKWAQGASTGTVILGGTRGTGNFQLDFPNGVFIHSDGSVYVTDTRNNRIQRLATNGQVTTVVSFSKPNAVFVSDDGEIYFSETQSHSVWKWNVSTSTLTLVAGSGASGVQAGSFNSPRGIWFDSGLNLYTADSDNNRIQKKRFPYASNASITVGGSSDGTGGFTATTLLSPYAVSVSIDGDLYVADYSNARVQKFTPQLQLTPTVAGTYSAILTSTQGCTYETNAVTVSTPVVTPSVSIAITTGSQVIPQGTSVTFTTTATNGGATPQYQWKKNGTNVGTNQATYTDATLIKNDVIACTMTPVNACVNLSSVNSNTITMNVGHTCTWTQGTQSYRIEWTFPSNWSPYGVPSTIDDVIIPTTTNRPTLYNDETVNSITFTGTNRVLLGNYFLSINNAITGANSDNYFVTNGNGGLIRRSISNASPTLFPVGSSEISYDPVTIQPTNSVDFTVKVKAVSSASAFTSTIANFSKVVPRQWDISPTGAAGSTVLKLTNGGTAFTPTNPKVGHYNTTTMVWEELNATYNNNVWTATMSQFSPFGVGSAGGFVAAVLPIELLAFLGKNTEGGNLLTWQTAEEKNVRDFDIERSRDGLFFEKIGTAKTKGSNANYEFLDLNFLTGLNYYRLKINDLDGKTDFSKIISIQANSKSKVKIYPSLTTGGLTIENAVRFDILNVTGQVLLSQTIPTYQSLFSIHHFPSGIYLIKGVDTEGGIFSQKIIKQ